MLPPFKESKRPLKQKKEAKTASTSYRDNNNRGVPRVTIHHDGSRGQKQLFEEEKGVWFPSLCLRARAVIANAREPRYNLLYNITSYRSLSPALSVMRGGIKGHGSIY